MVELPRKAVEWRDLPEPDQVANRAEVAHRQGITHARGTQVMGMLRLAREIRESILAMPETVRRRTATEPALRPIARLGAVQLQPA